MKKQIIMVFIAIALLLSLAGCNAAPSDDGSSKGGTLYIQVNPVIAVTYDASGTVTSVTAVTEDANQIVAQYQEYAGKECDNVVVELVTLIGEAGYLSKDSQEVAISISFEEDSSIPDEDFLTSVEQQIQTVVQERQWQGTVEITSPAVSDEETQPGDPGEATEPESAGPELPEGAEAQSDGTYLLTQYTNKSGDPVEKDSPYVKYIGKTVYDSEGRMIRKTKEVASYSLLLAEDWWQYGEDGALLSYTKKRFDNGGVMQEHYLQEYNADGQTIQTTQYNHDGLIDCILTYEYHSNGKIKAETTRDEAGALLGLKEYTQSGILTMQCTYYSNGNEKTREVYTEDGTPVETCRWDDNGNTLFLEEYFPNGIPKAHKRWNQDGTLIREFTAFTDKNRDNGIITEYDSSGKRISRSTMGNPDGSYDTDEFWDEDGIHYLFAFSDNLLREERYTYPDGGTLVIIYDHESGTKHVRRETSNSSRDLVSSIATDEPIEGYNEYWNEDGTYNRSEWKNGYKYKEISDGWKNVNGYKYRGTTYYYSNGQVKSSERYFYADGGRTYVEFDINGNEIYSEVTTKCVD